MRRDLVIVGAEGLAREAAMVAGQINAPTHEWRLVGSVDASQDQIGERVGSSTIVSTDDWLVNRKEPTDVVVAIGEPSVRAEVARRIQPCSHLRSPRAGLEA